MRRALVWVAKGRFVDKESLHASYKDHELDGICLADPDLRTFVTSIPAIVVALVIQHGFESEYSEAQCQRLIEDYVKRGRGGGSMTPLRV